MPFSPKYSEPYTKIRASPIAARRCLHSSSIAFAMNKQFLSALLALFSGAVSTTALAQHIHVSQEADGVVVTIENPKKYLLIPIEEERGEVKMRLETGSAADTWMDVRLAQLSTDYYVPLRLPEGEKAVVRFSEVSPQASAFRNFKLADEWNVKNTDYYRPLYHHTPSYGWMNDPNGLIYKDGEYHLYYQYNPYGSKWGNMHWGHAVSRDLVRWKELGPAIARDTLGHIYSGSTVIDFNNSAGFGKDALIAFYTSASDENGQLQCLAYSTDNGRTFTKYAGNPVLRPFDGLKDFRDPKVFWHEPAKAWYMIVSADKEMRFYRSADLKKWDYVSAFGRGYGAQPNQFECPDFFPLTLDGKQKYVMIVNINPGCLFGGSATEYFVGDFDGREFKCDTPPNRVKWLDYGKDHYATVTFSNTGDRVLAMPWISNWQYANVTPIRQYRGANGLPRELSLYRHNDDYYVATDVAREVRALRKTPLDLGTFATAKKHELRDVLTSTQDAFELEFDLTPGKSVQSGFTLYNAKGEKVDIYIDAKQHRLVMDRTKSGLVAFGERAVPHDIETAYDKQVYGGAKGKTFRKANSVNYVNDFALGTWAPLDLCEGKTYHFDVFVDKCSVEIFVDGGRIAMTNLVFPTVPYTSVQFYSKKGETTVSNARLYPLQPTVPTAGH